jgi:hypothetical protein
MAKRGAVVIDPPLEERHVERLPPKPFHGDMSLRSSAVIANSRDLKRSGLGACINQHDAETP